MTRRRFPCLRRCWGALVLCLACLPVSWIASTWSFPASSFSDDGSPDLTAPVQAEGDRLCEVTADDQALALFGTRLAAPLKLHELPLVRTTGRKIDQQTTVQLQDGVVRLISELAAWSLAAAIRTAVDGRQQARVRVLLERCEKHATWLARDQSREHLRRAWRFVSAIASLPEPPGDQPLPSSYEDYARALDQAHPWLVETDRSWVSVAEREGAEAIERRLLEVNSFVQQDETSKQQLAQWYIALRLSPVFRAQAVALALRAEAEAQTRATANWHQLRNWPDAAAAERGILRLCGTWQWTVHNHQHHLDQKTALSFPPPGSQDSGSARPARVVVLGDSVYLRWEFQGGYQEDSLLFTNGGQRLEGTFVNTIGGWGSITGKRISPCQRTSR